MSWCLIPHQLSLQGPLPLHPPRNLLRPAPFTRSVACRAEPVAAHVALVSFLYHVAVTWGVCWAFLMAGFLMKEAVISQAFISSTSYVYGDAIPANC